MLMRNQNDRRTFLTAAGMLVACLVLALYGCASSQADIAGKTGQRLVVRNAALISNADGPIQPESHLIIVDGRISAIGTGPVDVKRGDLEIDAEGMVVSPGIVDMHVHVFDPSDLLLMLAHGVTTARQMSGEAKLLNFKKKIANRELLGPDLVVASPVLNQPSQYASGSFHRFVKDPDHARRLIRKYAGMGYDLIKVYDGLDLTTYRAIVEEANTVGLRVAGHPSFMFGLDEFITPSLQSVEHSEMLYQAFLDYSYNEGKLSNVIDNVDSRVFITPTLVVWDDLAHLAAHSGDFDEKSVKDYVNPHLFEHLQPMIKVTKQVENAEQWIKKSHELAQITKVLHERGFPLLIGSDSGFVTLSGIGTIDEMQLLEKAGIDGSAIHRFATKNAANALKLETEIGELSTGMRADLVFTKHDPRDNLSTYRNVQGIIKAEYFYDADAVASMKEGAKQHMDALETLRWYLIDRAQQFWDR